MSKQDGKWPYHQSKNGAMVPCKSNPCKLHGGSDVMASSMEEAYTLMNGTRTKTLQKPSNDGTVENTGTTEQEISDFVERYKPEVRMMNGTEMLRIDKSRAPKDKKELERFSSWIRENKPVIIQWMKDRDAREKAKQQEREQRLESIEGLKEIKEASKAYSQYMASVRRAVNSDGTVKAMPEPFDEGHLDELHRKYPLADTYLKAKSMMNSNNAGLYSIGKQVEDAIADGADNEEATALMNMLTDEWQKRHMWD